MLVFSEWNLLETHDTPHSVLVKFLLTTFHCLPVDLEGNM